MVKQVIWDAEALNDIEQVFEYWEMRTGSNNYNRKLLNAFKKAALLIEGNNFIGTATTRHQTFRLVVNEFALYYKVNEDDIRILAVFDTRRNPTDNPIESDNG